MVSLTNLLNFNKYPNSKSPQCYSLRFYRKGVQHFGRCKKWKELYPHSLPSPAERQRPTINFEFGNSICSLTFAFNAAKTFINVSFVTLPVLLLSLETCAFCSPTNLPNSYCVNCRSLRLSYLVSGNKLIII